MCHLFGSTEKLRQSSRGGSLLDTALTSVALAATFAGGRKQGDFWKIFWETQWKLGCLSFGHGLSN
jgi:hypothetical protein